MSLHPYLTFSGTTREAMARYHQILGGRLDVMTFGDIPEGEDLPPGIPGDLIMHASLFFGDGDRLMASDDPSGDGSGVKGVSLNITLHDQAEGRRIFEALADGGTITMPLEATFWAPLFGVCIDRFGVSWMVNVEEATDAGAEGAA